MPDIDLTCETPLDPAEPEEQAADDRPRFGAETEELRGCWRIFFLFFGIVMILILALIAYMYAFVWQPWKSASERVAEERAAQLAALPPIPDIIGSSLVEVMLQLDEDYPEVLLFDSRHHAIEVSEDLAQRTDLNVGQRITLVKPPPGSPASETVSVWLGLRPELPPQVDEDSFWFDHAAEIEDRGTFPCLSCHDDESCQSCHELRLRSASSPFLADPESAPVLAEAVSGATGIPVDHVSAIYQGIGWYRVDILVDDPGPLDDEVDAARAAAVGVFPAAYNALEDAEVVVFRWTYSGSLEPLVEIGLERETYEQIQWMSVGPGDIPWVVDRYAVQREEN